MLANNLINANKSVHYILLSTSQLFSYLSKMSQSSLLLLTIIIIIIMMVHILTFVIFSITDTLRQSECPTVLMRKLIKLQIWSILILLNQLT